MREDKTLRDNSQPHEALTEFIMLSLALGRVRTVMVFVSLNCMFSCGLL